MFSGIIGKPHAYIGISGGGANGAYGAGVLTGWTASGKRPEFTVVTGTSTGSIIAPFAGLHAQGLPCVGVNFSILSFWLENCSPLAHPRTVSHSGR